MNTALKLITFLARKLVAIAIVILLIVMATFIAYDMANIYIIVSDGLSQRAETAIHGEDPSSLNRFFTLKHLNSDPIFRSTQFDDYNIQDYIYELKVKKVWVWPWESETEVVVEEYIPESSWKFSITEEMRERLMAAQMPAEEPAEQTGKNEEAGQETETGSGDENGEGDAGEQGQKIELEIPPPTWQNGEKVIEMRKVEGQWKIDGIVFVRSIEPEQDEKDKSE